MVIRTHHSAPPQVTLPARFRPPPPTPAPQPRRVETLREAIALVSPGAAFHEAPSSPAGEDCSGGILLASDGSPGSWAAARAAIRLARLCGSELRLLYVPDGMHSEHYREVLKQLTMMERATGPQPVVVDDPGRVADRICETAEGTGASLIVLGHRGLERVEGLGSVSERVMQKTQTSVLLVPPGSPRHFA